MLGLLSPRQSLKNRHPLHAVFCTINLCLASAFLAFTVEGHLRGWNRLIAAQSLQLGDPSFMRGLPFLKAVAAQTLVEYYWHRLMHCRPFYKVRNQQLAEWVWLCGEEHALRQKALHSLEHQHTTTRSILPPPLLLSLSLPSSHREKGQCCWLNGISVT